MVAKWVEMFVEIDNLRRDCVFELNVDIESYRSFECVIQFLWMISRSEKNRIFLYRPSGPHYEVDGE